MCRMNFECSVEVAAAHATLGGIGGQLSAESSGRRRSSSAPASGTSWWAACRPLSMSSPVPSEHRNDFAFSANFCVDIGAAFPLHSSNQARNVMKKPVSAGLRFRPRMPSGVLCRPCARALAGKFRVRLEINHFTCGSLAVRCRDAFRLIFSSRMTQQPFAGPSWQEGEVQIPIVKPETKLIL